MQFLVYKASAGSGKTFTLVKEYLRMALEGNDPYRFKKILAITFTNKAATEMKERVITMLHEMASPNGSTSNAGKIMSTLLMDELKLDPVMLRNKASRLLSTILHQYNDFSIGTIDSFMHRVVRTFAQDLRMPINFTVELNNDVLIQMAVDELLEKIGTDKDITEALIGFTLYQTAEEKSSRIEVELADTARDLLNEQNAIPISTLRKLRIHDFIALRNQFIAECKKLDEELREAGLEGMKVLNNAGIESKDLYQGARGIYGWFKKLTTNADNPNPEPNSYTLKTLDENKWNSKSGQAKLQAIKHAAQYLEPLALNTIDLIEKKLPDYRIKLLLRDGLFKLALLNEISKIIDRIRGEEGIVHISEFNRRVAKIVLEEPVPFIYERLGEKYQHFMIDEFQDTSVMQWQNLLPLIQNGLAQNAGSLIVGDGKQAIYRFRGGEVGLFANLPEPFPETAQQLILERHQLLKQLYKAENLNRNFRSTRAIIDFNNRFYHYLAEQYIPEPFKSVYHELEQETSAHAEEGYVQIEWIPPALDLSQREAEHHTRTLAIVRNLTETKNFQFRDIAILVRNNRQGAKLAGTFVNQGIPVISGDSLQVDSSPEVSVLLACLNVLSDRNISLNLFHICTWLIRQNKLPFNNLEELIVCVSYPGEKELILLLENHGYKIRRVNQGGSSLFETCNQLIRLFEINTQLNPYVLFFLEAVWARTGKSATDSAVFLDWWEENRQLQCLKLPETANAVRILTIHKSKGLQFPVVIYPYAHGDGSKNGNEWIEGAGLLPGNLPAARLPLSKKIERTKFNYLLQQENNKQILDRINLMYVATTRPETALYIISGRSGIKGSIKKGSEEYLESYLNLICPKEFQSGCVSWGDPNFQNPSKGESERSSGAKIPAFTPGEWSKHILLSAQSGKAWKQENTALAWGNLLHTALESVRSKNDIQKSLQLLLSGGLITQEEWPRLEQQITEVVNLPLISDFFSEGLAVKTERDLLLPDGQCIRPDRAIMLEDTWVIIDYKSGKQDKKHGDQVRKYMRQLSSLKPFKVKGYLVYLHQPPEVIAVLPDN
jgi:ATP-dependent exoDNAse (exonuclease V) beta subunit